MTQEKQGFTRRVTIRFKPAEFQKIERLFKQSSHRKLSEYIRDVLFNKPVTIITSDQSSKDIVAALFSLKNELLAIGRNLNQAVRKLNRLDQPKALSEWVLERHNSIRELEKKVAAIDSMIFTISKGW